MEKKDIVSWNVLISGYAMYGEANHAIEMFKKMEQTEIKPNELTFLAVLSACAHAGVVEEGKSIFSRMKDYYLMPTLKHYSCMADLLGRSGNLDDAETLVLSMPIPPDAAIWGSLLSSCKIHSQVEKGIRIAKHAIESDPENDGYYIAISDLYSSVGMWEEVEMICGCIEMVSGALYFSGPSEKDTFIDHAASFWADDSNLILVQYNEQITVFSSFEVQSFNQCICIQERRNFYALRALFGTSE
ncbi:hypothetical protein HAX54_021579 [Datura stramonium]|uniref:Pentatricopeptide repeat-containing protein n=1 Tax=Datura stramonium TaxID=4076 RepID=A0ABS8UVE5_DATST|nr:hypothetical protein [Datura stramonium]